MLWVYSAKNKKTDQQVDFIIKFQSLKQGNIAPYTLCSPLIINGHIKAPCRIPQEIAPIKL